VDVLTQKFHGIPGWVILLVVAGGAYYLYSRYESGSSTTAADSTDEGSTTGTETDTGSPVPVYVEGGSLSPSNTGGTVTTGTTKTKTVTNPKHAASNADIVAQMLKDYAKNHNYFKNHPGAWEELHKLAPKKAAKIPVVNRTGPTKAAVPVASHATGVASHVTPKTPSRKVA
jgi:hypothetical protein